MRHFGELDSFLKLLLYGIIPRLKTALSISKHIIASYRILTLGRMIVFGGKDVKNREVVNFEVYV